MDQQSSFDRQYGKLRDGIVELRDRLDATLGRLDEFNEVVDRTAGEARSVAEALGFGPRRKRPGIGILGIIGIGIGALYLLSPQTVTGAIGRVRGFFEQMDLADTAQEIGNSVGVAAHDFGDKASSVVQEKAGLARDTMGQVGEKLGQVLPGHDTPPSEPLPGQSS